MATLTIELPDELAQQVQGRGISQRRLEQVVINLIQEFLRALPETSAGYETAPTTTRIDGVAFARRVIANNRELFEELAQR